MLALLVAASCCALFAAGCAANHDASAPSDRSRAPVGVTAGASEPRTCGSDLTCPLGFVCAKKAGAFTGDCLRSVDENGAPVVVPHSSDSYGVGPAQCSASSDCPSRFRCDEGRCVL